MDCLKCKHCPMFTRKMRGKCLHDWGHNIIIELVYGKPMLECCGELVDAGECFLFEPAEGE